MRKTIFLTTTVLLAGSAHAGLFSEVESNNTLGTANDLGVFNQPGGSVIIDGVVGDSDVDWFGFTLTNDATLSIFAAFSLDSGADGVMQLVEFGGDVIEFDDDSGIGLMPAIQTGTLTAGVYYVGLSGFGDAFSDSVDTDELFDGQGHSENFAYKLSIGFTVVPAPGALALLGLGGLAVTRRTRR